jgi:hypothetical protein
MENDARQILNRECVDLQRAAQEGISIRRGGGVLFTSRRLTRAVDGDA